MMTLDSLQAALSAMPQLSAILTVALLLLLILAMVYVAYVFSRRGVDVEGLWRKLDTMPSTNVKIAAGLGMTIATCFVYLVWVVIFEHKIDSDPWEAWLMFLAAVLAVSTWQFIGKRKTYAAPSPDSERANVPPTPPPATPAAPSGVTRSPEADPEPTDGQ